jgi:hypothetical protein
MPTTAIEITQKMVALKNCTVRAPEN